MQDKKSDVLQAKKSSLVVQVTHGLTVQVIPDLDHEFLLTSEEVAHGYGISEATIRSHKSNNSAEFVEGKHFISSVEIINAGKNLTSKRTYWTKRGIVRLGFFIKSQQARLFRDWAEDYILNGKLIRKDCVSGQPDYLDLRDRPYDTVELHGKDVRHIIHEDADWYSLNDVHRAINSRTSSHQAVKKLNAKRRLASKFYIYGNTQPTWFVKSSGLALILSGSRMLKNRGLKLVLPIPQAPQLKAGGAL